ncbi:MAG: hypothetical protein LBO64_02445 [Desulfovibrio sp.]|jgi:hypothetical protein|nr:hypothetical protein [Desulfovibrio sp.]
MATDIFPFSLQRHGISPLDSETLRRYLYICRHIRDGFSVLDAESGLGHGAYFLREYSPASVLYALDSIARYTELAATIHADQEIRFLTGIPGDDALALPRFDCVTLLNAERNIALTPEYIATLAGSLFKGGLLALAFVNATFYVNYPKKDALPFLHNPEIIRHLLEDSGFSTIDAKSQWPGQTEFSDGIDGHICLIVAKKDC